MNLVLKSNGITIADGVPEFYISNKDFEELLKNANKAKEFYSVFNRDVCVGNLGELQNEVYTDKEYKVCKFTGSFEKEGLKYYEAF